MVRPEGLHIPEIQPASIEAAEQQPKPFDWFCSEQFFLGRWMNRQFRKYDVGKVLAGIAIPLPAVKYEAGIAYGAMKHAYSEHTSGQNLPRVEPRTIDEYFLRLCPNSKREPHSGKAIDGVDHEALIAITADFIPQQLYLGHRYLQRFGNDLVSNGVVCIAMAYNIIESQLAS